jgi:hypothetical protein
MQICAKEFFESNIFKNSIWFDFVKYHTSIEFFDKIIDIFYKDIIKIYPNTAKLFDKLDNKKFLGKEDYLFWLNIITKNHKIFFFNNYLSTINIGNDNLTNYNNMNIISIKEHLKVLMFLKNKEKIKFIFKNVLMSKFIIMYYKNKNYLAIIRLFKTKKNKIINAIAVFLFLKFVLFLYRLN